MNRTTPLSLVALATLSLALAGCGKGEAKMADKKDETPPIPVETATVSAGSVSAVYSGTASLESEQQATVVAKVSGVVTRIVVEEGTRVKAGQVLAKIEDARYKLELDRARANLAKLEQEYNRNLQLHEKGLVSADAYERVKFDLDALKAQYDIAKLDFEYTDIKAPIDGVVSERMIKAGNMVTVNQATFVITDFDPLLANVFVPERELDKLRAKQKASITADALPDRKFDAIIDRISPTVDPKTGTFKVTVAVSDPTRRLKPGMFGRIDIVYDVRNNTLLVPRSAVIQEDAESAVFVVKDGVASRRTVSVGYANNGNIEVTTGIKVGEQVVTVGQGSLKEGSKVNVVGGAKATQTEVAVEEPGKKGGQA
jgi:membrane fusion protein (multidrug efflux system)